MSFIVSTLMEEIKEEGLCILEQVSGLSTH